MNWKVLTCFLVLLFFNNCNQFDSEIPDTINNKYHFKNFLKVEITQDVKNIYAFGDEIGIDATYMIAFNCNSSTAEKIIKVNNFKADISSQNGIQVQTLKWWDYNEVSKLPKYSWNDGNYFRYFWYDSIKEKAYYLDFDL